jgi:hypothetical protein
MLPGRRRACKQDQITTGIAMRDDACRDSACALGSHHADIVAEHDAPESIVIAKNILDPDARISGRVLVDAGIRDMRHHDGLRACADRVGEGHEVVGPQDIQRARVRGAIEVGILEH